MAAADAGLIRTVSGELEKPYLLFDARPLFVLKAAKTPRF
jgi:hypothetical protein